MPCTGPAGRWTYTHRRALRITAVIIASLVFVFWGLSSWVTAVVIAVVLLIVLGLIELIGRPPAQPQVAAQDGEILTADVAQFDPLEIAPDALVGVQVWGVGWKLLQPDALGAPLGQKIFDRLPAMDRRAIPDDQELTGDLPQKMLEKADDVRTFVRVLLDQQEETAGGRDATDDRQMIAAQRQAQHWGLSARGVGADGPGQQIEAGLVDPDDGPAFLLSPLFRAGHRVVRQASMAASLRWLARWIGCWTLHPAARSNFPTWLG